MKTTSATLEPDGTATGCNPVQVGSTPTGVSWEAMIRPGHRRTASCPLRRRLAACVPKMGSDRGRVNRFAQRIEHQTANLGTRVRLPYQHQGAENATMTGPREAGERAVGPRRMSCRSCRRRGPWSMRPGLAATAAGSIGRRASTHRGHAVRGYRFHRPSGKRRQKEGDSRQGLVPSGDDPDRSPASLEGLWKLNRTPRSDV